MSITQTSISITPMMAMKRIRHLRVRFDPERAFELERPWTIPITTLPVTCINDADARVDRDGEFIQRDEVGRRGADAHRQGPCRCGSACGGLRIIVR